MSPYQPSLVGDLNEIQCGDKDDAAGLIDLAKLGPAEIPCGVRVGGGTGEDKLFLKQVRKMGLHHDYSTDL